MARTQATKTGKTYTRMSALMIQNKDPNMDYSMRRKVDIDNGGGVDMYGYEPVNSMNSKGETFGSYPMRHRTAGKNQLVYHDTILCKRPKEISAFYKAEEDERYNSQVRLVQGAAKRARAALRDLDPDSVFEDKIKYGGPGMTQRPGPTEEK